MNILVTGHMGFIGKSLFHRLSRNHKLVGIDMKGGNDLLDPDLWFPEDIDLVIHLAGKSGVRESLKDPAAYWRNNIEASRRLYERYKNVRIMYASSSSAYEPDLNPYAASKYCLEELASRYPNTLGMRFHTVYSDDCPRENMFYNKLRNGTLEYTTNHYRDFIHLDDMVDAIELLVECEDERGVIDIGTGNPVKVSDLAPDLPIRINTPGERQFTCADTQRMKQLGFVPKRSII